MTSPSLLAVGGAHIDRRGQVSGIFVPQASNPGVLIEEVGGGIFNAARNISRQGVAVSLLSVRGGDAAGERVARAIAAAGIADLSAIFLDRATPSYTAFLDRHGELIAGLADMALYEIAFTKQVSRRNCRDAVNEADALLLDANLPEAALRRLAAQAEGKSIHAIAISPAKVKRLGGILGTLSCLFMNAHEAASLAGQVETSAAAAALKARGLKSGVITQGAGPVTAFDATGIFAVPPPRPGRIVDVTGAGDALAGATIAAMMHGKRLREALRHGIAAAMLTLQSPSSVAEATKAEFAAALRRVPEAEDLGT